MNNVINDIIFEINQCFKNLNLELKKILIKELIIVIKEIIKQKEN